MTPTKEQNQKIAAKIAKLRSMGCKLSDEKIYASVSKQILPNKKAEKRSAKKWAKRDFAKTVKASTKFDDMAEMNKYFASQNLPSSMR